MDAPAVRRDHHGNGSTVSTVHPAQLGLHATLRRPIRLRSGQSSRDRPLVNRPPKVLLTHGEGTGSGGHGAQPVDQPVGTANQGVEIDRGRRRILGRPAGQGYLLGRPAEDPPTTSIDLDGLVRGSDWLVDGLRAVPA